MSSLHKGSSAICSIPFFLGCSNHETPREALAESGMIQEFEVAFLQTAMQKAEEIANGSVRGIPLIKRSERYANKMKEILNLEDEQIKKLVALRLSFLTQAKAAKEKFIDNEAGIQEGMQTITAEAQKTFEYLLTEEQLAVWKTQPSKKLP